MQSCTQTLPCGTSDDQCMLAAIVQADPNWQQNPDVLACQAKHASCDAAGGVSPATTTASI